MKNVEKNNHNFFYYSKKNADFSPVFTFSMERLVHLMSIYILGGVIVTGIILSIIGSVVGTPTEIALKAENDVLVNYLEGQRKELAQLKEQFDHLEDREHRFYRTILGISDWKNESARGGRGGVVATEQYKDVNIETGKLLRHINDEIVTMQWKLKSNEKSFGDIKTFFETRKEEVNRIPIIRPTKGILLSGYGTRYHPILKYDRFHGGIDFRVEIGQEVYATADGVVRIAEYRGTYGLLLAIKHGKYETRYAHLSKFADGIEPGTEVKRGTIVAYGGNSGLSEGPHLHYEVWYNGGLVDPITFIVGDLTLEEYTYYRTIASTSKRSMD